MTTSILAVLFIAILMAAGYGVGAAVLGWRDRLALTGMTFTGGVAILMMAVNILGYVMPIESAFYVGFCITGIFALGGIIDLIRFGIRISDPPPKWLTSILWFITLLAGFMGARFLGSDPLLWTYFPLPATIMHGNFPVMEPMNPWQIAGYHYIPALFVAVMSSLTKVSLMTAYAWQPFLGAGSILFFAAAIARKLGATWRTAFIVALLALAGDGLTWFKGFDLIKDLWQHFVMGNSLDVPFRNLTPMLTGWSNLRFIGHRPTITGVPYVFASLYCLLLIWTPGIQTRLKHVAGMLVIFLLCAALTTETSFALLIAAISLAIVCGFFTKNVLKQSVFALIAVVVVSLIIARFQGGLFTAFPQGDHPSFALALDGRLYTYGSKEFMMIWDIRFWRDFGFPVLLLPFACVFAWRKRTEQPFFLFIALLALMHLSVPFIVRYVPRPTDLYHLFHAGMGLASFLVGYWLLTSWMTHSKKHSVAGSFIILSMLVTGTSYLIVRSIVPNFRFVSEPLFAQMPQPSEEQRAMEEWVRSNTTQADWFYMGSLMDQPDDVLEHGNVDESRMLFMGNTGRFTIGPTSWDNTTEETRVNLRLIEWQCATSAFVDLHIRYLIIATEERAQWFQKYCSTAPWVLKYGTPTSVPRIYEKAF